MSEEIYEYYEIEDYIDTNDEHCGYLFKSKGNKCHGSSPITKAMWDHQDFTLYLKGGRKIRITNVEGLERIAGETFLVVNPMEANDGASISINLKSIDIMMDSGEGRDVTVFADDDDII